MPSIKDRIVFITGATSGIGEACARKFAARGSRLILLGRRRKRLKQLATQLQDKYNALIHLVPLDVRDRESVEQTIEALPVEWDAIDILINNAGLARGLAKLHEGRIDDWEEMVDTNVKGLLYVTRAVVPGMVERGHGHIINIGSIAGHEVYPQGNVYCATKHAVDAITKGLRMDLVDTPIRVSTIDPGLVNTEFSVVRFHGDKERARNVYQDMTPLSGDDIAETAVFIASRPAHVSINQVVITPTCQASATIVHRGKRK